MIKIGVRVALIISAVIMAFGTLVPDARGQGETIKIVSSLPRSGSNKGMSDSMVNAFQMALDEVNAQVGGFTIVYQDLDDATPERGAWDASQEAANTSQAVADPDVMVYLGTFNSGAAKIAMPILNHAHLAMISPANTYPGLTKPGKGLAGEPGVFAPTGVRNYVRVTPADDLQGDVGARWAQHLGVQRAYVLDDTELYGRLIATSFAQSAAQIGLTIVGGPEGINTAAPDYRALASKIRDTTADLVYFGGITQNNTGQLFKDLRAVLGPDVKLMGPDAIFESEFLQSVGDAAEGTYITFGGVPPSKLPGKGADWYAAYTSRFGAEPDAYAPYSYVAMKVALDAIGRAGVNDRASIRDAVLATHDDDGILGSWSFDANGDTTLTMMSGRQVKQGLFNEDDAVILTPDQVSRTLLPGVPSHPSVGTVIVDDLLTRPRQLTGLLPTFADQPVTRWRSPS